MEVFVVGVVTNYDTPITTTTARAATAAAAALRCCVCSILYLVIIYLLMVHRIYFEQFKRIALYEFNRFSIVLTVHIRECVCITIAGSCW